MGLVGLVRRLGLGLGLGLRLGLGLGLGLRLGLLLLCAGAGANGSTSFQLSSVLAPALVTRHPDLLKDLQRYIDQHSVETVLADPGFCNRTFAVGVFGGPHQMGNHLHEFMNAFAISYVTNRTIYWKLCDRRPCVIWDNLGDFLEVFDIHGWMLSIDQFNAHWKQAGCHGVPTATPLTSTYHHSQAEETFACCGVDTLDQSYPNIDIGNHEAHQAYALFSASARLGEAARKRAHMLFSPGEDFGYGMLFRSIFRVKEAIRTENDRLMSAVETKDAVVISVHLRHASNEDVTHHQDSAGEACVHEILARHAQGRKCVIALASDRSESFQSWLESNTSSSCIILHTNHTADKTHPQYSEHGPFTGYLSVLDMDLLSRSHFMVGSSYLLHKYRNFASTFSLLIAELRATNGLELAETVKPLYLPTCKEIIGAQWDTKAMFTDPEHKCVAPYLKFDIKMPPHCLP